MTSSPRHFSRSTKRQAYARSGGNCESCGAKLGYGGIRYDHRNPWHLSRDSSLENCQVLCTLCDNVKTYAKDLVEIAKVQRLADERIGIKKPGKKLPAGRDSPVRKTFNHGVVPRLERGEAHRRAMANRRGE